MTARPELPVGGASHRVSADCCFRPHCLPERHLKGTALCTHSPPVSVQCELLLPPPGRVCQGHGRPIYFVWMAEI